MNILILEDNTISRNALAEMLRQISSEIEVITAGDVKEAEDKLEKNVAIDLFLLDINLDMKKASDDSGLVFAKNLRDRHDYEFTTIVFITSMINLEMKSFREAQCYAYITKPFKKSEVEKIVRRVMNRKDVKEEKIVTIRKDGINYRIKENDIICIQAIVRGVRIYMPKEEMDVRYLTIKQLLEELDSESFIQCHRTSVVNVNYIENIDAVNQMIKLRGRKEPVEIGITYKSALKHWM